MCNLGLLLWKSRLSNTNGIARSLNAQFPICWVWGGLGNCAFSELAIPFELDRRLFYNNHVQPTAAFGEK